MLHQLQILLAKLLVILGLTTPTLGGLPVQPTYFAEVDKNGVVLRVIVADQAFINSGAVGNPASWIQTSIDGTLRKNYAGKGYTYNNGLNAFIPPKPRPDATLSSTTARWNEPPITPAPFINATST